jgi:hypothetical protein
MKHSLARATLALLLAGSLCGVAAQNERGANDYSAAERLLFTTPHLAALRLPTTLRYTLRKSGSLEEAFEDSASVQLGSVPGGGCCTARTRFLSGARQLTLPEVERVEGNPVVLHFLERDVREMQRLTGGSQTHFRKRIRMAIYAAATVRELSLNYRGRLISGQELLFSPYLDDPNRPRFETFARKEYRFFLAPTVPGGVLAIRTRVAADDGAPLMVEELLLEGAQSPVAAKVPS